MNTDGAFKKHWLVENFIGINDLVLLSGTKDSGCSTVAMGWALAVASGMPWRGQKVRQGGVVYFARPNPDASKEAQTAASIYLAGAGLASAAIPVRVVSSNRINLLLPPGAHKNSEVASNPVHDLLRWCKAQYGALRLVVIDTVADYFHDSVFDPNVLKTVRSVAATISATYDCAVLLVLHAEPGRTPETQSINFLAEQIDVHFKLFSGVLARVKPASKEKRQFRANFKGERERAAVAKMAKLIWCAQTQNSKAKRNR